MVNTVSREAECFSLRAHDGATLFKQAYGMVGFPSSKYFKNMMRSTLISNCPITSDDITMSNKIYGPNQHSLKGKILRKQLKPVMTDYIYLTSELIK